MTITLKHLKRLPKGSVFSVTEAAYYAGVSKSAIYLARDTDRIQVEQIGHLTVIPLAGLLEYIENTTPQRKARCKAT